MNFFKDRVFLFMKVYARNLREKFKKRKINFVMLCLQEYKKFTSPKDLVHDINHKFENSFLRVSVTA